jgi:transposase
VDVSTKTDMDTNGGRRTNKRWPEALKREIVAASFAPGASVSVIARQYDVNVNQVFSWRHRYGPAVDAVAPPTPPAARPRLVPVTIGLEPEGSAALSGSSGAGDTITIEVAGTYLVRVGAKFDDRALRRVLDCLGRASTAREKDR